MEAVCRCRARPTASGPVQPGRISPFLMNCCSRGRPLPSSAGWWPTPRTSWVAVPRSLSRRSGELAPAHVDLVLGGLRHGNQLAGVIGAADQLVDHAGRGRPGAGHQRRADAVGIDRGGPAARRWRIRPGPRSPRSWCARCRGSSSSCADPLRLGHEVAGVQPDGAELVPGEVDGGADGRLDVVRVHQQRGAGPQRGQLRREGLALGVVEQGEGVGARCRRSAGRSAVRRPGWRCRRSRR